MNTRRKQHHRGMTLIEIVVVIAIISLLSGAIAVSAMEIYRGAKRKAAVTEVHTLGTALDAYAMKKGKYPTVAQGLQALADERLIKELHPDPWGNDYVYSFEKGEPKVVSYGEDGQPGGADFDADIPDDTVRKVARASPTSERSAL
jgi:general secretion pathway protein G